MTNMSLIGVRNKLKKTIKSIQKNLWRSGGKINMIIVTQNMLLLINVYCFLTFKFEVFWPGSLPCLTLEELLFLKLYWLIVFTWVHSHGTSAQQSLQGSECDDWCVYSSYCEIMKLHDRTFFLSTVQKADDSKQTWVLPYYRRRATTCVYLFVLHFFFISKSQSIAKQAVTKMKQKWSTRSIA